MLLEKGRILDKLKRYDEAFACFAAAKDRARGIAGKSYLEREAREMADRLRQFFVAERLRLMPPSSTRQDCAQPIFILGFPRSGTTLMEQALSGHPKISAGDELPFINEFGNSITRWFGSPLSYPEALAELWMGDNRRGLEELRDVYLRKVELRGIVAPRSSYFTDKMPLNEMHLGLISCIFPRSPLIHLLRHPLDVVLSVYSHHLTHGYFCAYALETIARHYVLVMDLVHHYRAQLAMRYLPVRYEDMVDDVEGNLRRILDFIGEPFDERCVNFQENRRVPHTPSYAQVTEKVYQQIPVPLSALSEASGTGHSHTETSDGSARLPRVTARRSKTAGQRTTGEGDVEDDQQQHDRSGCSQSPDRQPSLRHQRGHRDLVGVVRRRRRGERHHLADQQRRQDFIVWRHGGVAREQRHRHQHGLHLRRRRAFAPRWRQRDQQCRRLDLEPWNIGRWIGSGSGVYITGGAGTVTNNAAISGVAYGVGLGKGGLVTNTSSITGGEDEVIIQGASGTVVDFRQPHRDCRRWDRAVRRRKCDKHIECIHFGP